MGHGITATDSVFSVRQQPWHGIGVVLPEYPTREEAQQLAHPWEPDVEPLYRKIDGEFVEVEDYRLGVRTDNREPLAVNPSAYPYVQNQTLWDMAEAVEGLEPGSVRYETAGSLLGGRKVWVLIALNEPVRIKGDPSESIPYLCLQNSHDRTGSFRAQATVVRTICHAKGTKVSHGDQWINVEDHPGVMGSKTESGLSLSLAGLPFTETVTLDHRYWGRKIGDGALGWVYAHDIASGTHELALPISDAIEDACLHWDDVRANDPNWWWAIGNFWADGHLMRKPLKGERQRQRKQPRQGQVVWSVSKVWIADRLRGLYESFGSPMGAGSQRPGLTALTKADESLCALLESFYREWPDRAQKGGKGAREKVAPAWVERIDPALQMALIRGYLDGDGSTDKARGGEILSSVSLDSLLAVRRILARSGVVSLLRAAGRAEGASTIQGREVHTRRSWTLRIPETPDVSRIRIEDGFLVSRVERVEWVPSDEFYPLDCSETDNQYDTHFARSHNCKNTSILADLDSQQRGTECVFRHTKNIDDRITEATAALQGWRESVTNFKDQMELLAANRVTPAQAEWFIDKMIPMPTHGLVTTRVANNVTTARQDLFNTLHGPTNEGTERTSLGLFNAATEYADWVVRANSPESRFSRNFIRSNKGGLKAHAFRLALAAASAR